MQNTIELRIPLDVRFQETISVAINSIDGGIVGNGDMTRGNANEFSMFLMRLVDGDKAFTLTSLEKEPKVGESS